MATTPIPLPVDLVDEMIVRFTVHGRAFNQQVINVFDWRVITPFLPGPDPLRTNKALLLLREQFRNNILPRLTVDYTVNQYEAAWISSVTKVTDPVTGAISYTVAYRDQTILKGVLADDTGLKAAPSQTLFDAVTVRKICFPNNKNTRGSSRFSPMPESDVQADGQTLKVLSQADWDGALSNFYSVLTDVLYAKGLRPVVFSEAVGSGPPFPITGGGVSVWSQVGPPAIQSYADIEAVIVQNLVRSQVSRKPRNPGY